ncbi:MAG: glyceraldehyde-3-phosphate dehydrogenase, partial [Bacteroidetes bacterium]|nr:glyceraldehyde-3-phosphate dehydrogenase [Bacteroidota bacterium]
MAEIHEMQTQRDHTLSDWRKQEKAALELLKIVGDLRFDKGIELVLFRKDIYDSRPSEVLHDHKIARNYIDHDVSIDTTLNIARDIFNREGLNPMKLDIGKMAAEIESNAGLDITTYVNHCLNNLRGHSDGIIESRDVVLYGFGRIGRLLARRIISTTGRGDQLLLRAVVLRGKMKNVEAELKKRAALLLSDSVHGDFQGTVRVDPDQSSIVVNGSRINFIFSDQPDAIDYTHYGLHDAVL